MVHIVRKLGTQLERAFKHPIEEIKEEFGLLEEDFLELEEEQYLGDRSFPCVSLFITDSSNKRWVDTLIKGRAALVQLKDVGAPIVVIRMWQENEAGELGNVMFEAEIPLNVKLEKLSGQFTAISCLKSGEYLGFYFNKGASDCSIFNMHLTELHEQL